MPGTAASARKRLKSLRSEGAFAVKLALDSAIFRVVQVLPPARSERRYHVLLAAPGDGNVGDQAMLDVFIEQVRGDILVVTASAKALDLPRLGEGDRRAVALPGLTHSSNLTHFRSVLRFARLLKQADSLSLTGADTMDGGYHAKPSVMRWKFVEWGARSGVESRVLGFSWNADPAPITVKAMRQASARKVAMYSRDPLSFGRIEADGSRSAIQTTDTVFELQARDEQTAAFETVSGWRNEGHRVAVVNASGLVARRVDQPVEYERIVRWLVEHDYRVILLPHVDRGPEGDVPATEAVRAKITDLDVALAMPLLTPPQVRAVSSQADIVVTGRMHLSVMALSQGVPAIILATQGKVEGLLQLFGLPEFAVAPVTGFADTVIRLLESFTADPQPVLDRVAERLPAVVDAASKNFDRLRPQPPK